MSMNAIPVTGFIACEHCNGEGVIEPDNNGPIGDCPVCEGTGVLLPKTGEAK